MNIPEAYISVEELTEDIEQRTNGHAPSKRPRKAKNAFPLNVFPPRLEELIKGAESALGTPPDFLAAACLLAVAAASGGTYQLQVKRGTVHRPIFFLVLVGRPNVNKSFPLKFALMPITQRDGENYEEYRRQKAEFDAVAGMTKKERKEQGITELPPSPVFLHSVTNDATPEALASTHRNNLKGITVHRDELAGWVKDFNRYHSGGEMENWLTIWNGDPLTINRKTSEPLHLKFTNINVTGTIQPAVIEELANGGRALNGFIDRLLFVWPEGLEKPVWTDDEINQPLKETYWNAISRLMGLTFHAEGGANTLTLEPAAKACLFNFFNKENKPLCDETENENLAGIYGKFDVHTARITIALHLLKWAYSNAEQPPTQVEKQTVEQAIKVAVYFREQALKVYNRLHNSNPVEQLPADKRKIYDALPAEFKTKDGEAIADRYKMPGRTFRHWLTTFKGTLFESSKHGQWAKIY